MVVDAVSSEPVSGEFPVKQGKNREFSRNHPIIRPIGPSNTLVSLVFCVEFPKHRNREYFQRNREFNSWNRELSNYLGGSGNRPTVHRSFKSGARNRLSVLNFAAELPKIR